MLSAALPLYPRRPSNRRPGLCAAVVVAWVILPAISATTSSASPVRIHPIEAGGLYYEGEPLRLEIEGGAVEANAPERIQAGAAMNSRRAGPMRVPVTVLDVANTTVTTVVVHPTRRDAGTLRGALVFELPSLPIGYYSVLVRGSRAFTKLAVIRRPPEVPAEESPFGVDAFLAWRTGDQASRRSAARAIRRAGIPWVRDRLSWNETQPTSDTFSWGRYDDSLRAQHDAGLRVLQIFHDIPTWASRVTTGTSETRSHVAPRDPLAAERYFEVASRHWRDRVDAWELWNEFDAPTFFEGTPDEYASVLRSAALGVRRGNPAALILSGSTTLCVYASLKVGDRTFRDVNGARFVDRLLSCSVGDCFDIWNMHYYGPVDGVVAQIRRNRDLLRKHGLEGKPVWITETGQRATVKMGVFTDPLERSQAEDLVKVYVLALSEGVERIFYFCFPNFLEGGVSPWGVAEAEPDRPGWIPKPAFAALTNLVTLLAGRSCIGRYPGKNPDLEAFVFPPDTRAADVPTSVLLVAWSKGRPDSTDPLYGPPGGWPEKTALLDIYGRRLALSPSSNAPIRIGRSPVFIFAKVKLPARPSEGLQLTLKYAGRQKPTSPRPWWCEIETHGTQYDSTTKSISGRIRIVNGDTHARRFHLVTGALEVARSYVAVARGAGFPLTGGDYEIPANGVSEVPLRLKFKDLFPARRGKAVAIRTLLQPLNIPEGAVVRTVRFLDFRPPFRVGRPRLIPGASFLNPAPDSKWAVDLRVQAPGLGKGRAIVGLDYPNGVSLPPALDRLKVIRTECKMAGKDSIVSVPICSLRELKAAFENLKRTPQFHMRILAGSYQWDGIVRPEVAVIAPAGFQKAFPFWRLVPAEEALVSGVEGERRTSRMGVEIRPSWNDEFLILDIHVTDSSITNPLRFAEPWLGDALEIFLDLRRNGLLGAPTYGDGVFQIFAIPADPRNPKPLLTIWQPSGRKVWRSTIQLGPEDDGEGWGGRVQLAWSDLGIPPPRPGREIGIEFALDDLDQGGHSVRQLVWRGTSDDWRDPSVFSRVELLGESTFDSRPH